MAKRRPKKGATKSSDVRGHQINYRQLGEIEEVEIDGEVMQAFRVGDQYQLECAAYEEAHDTLLAAAEAYAKTLPP